MISGHRRLFAAKAVGLAKIPAFIRPMTDDEATIVMVDSNIQREELLPSEKAFAYKMRYEAMRKQGNRSDLTSSLNGTKSKSKSTSSQNGTKLQQGKNVSQNGTKLRADEELASQVGESRNQVHRYIRLTELISELLEMTDQGRVALLTAVEISYLDEKLQKWVYEYIKENGNSLYYEIVW